MWLVESSPEDAEVEGSIATMRSAPSTMRSAGSSKAIVTAQVLQGIGSTASSLQAPLASDQPVVTISMAAMSMVGTAAAHPQQRLGLSSGLLPRAAHLATMPTAQEGDSKRGNLDAAVGSPSCAPSRPIGWDHEPHAGAMLPPDPQTQLDPGPGDRDSGFKRQKVQIPDMRGPPASQPAPGPRSCPLTAGPSLLPAPPGPQSAPLAQQTPPTSQTLTARWSAASSRGVRISHDKPPALPASRHASVDQAPAASTLVSCLT